MFRATLSMTAFAACCALSGNAESAPTLRSHLSHGPANCQPALPVFDGNIRKRPKGIANEGNSVAFITCDFDTGDYGRPSTTFMYLEFNKRVVPEATVTCTFVDGLGTETWGPYLVRSLVLEERPDANASISVHYLQDNGGNLFHTPSVSCALPPDVELTIVMQEYFEEI